MRYGKLCRLGLLAVTLVALAGASQCMKDVAIDFVMNAQSEAESEALSRKIAPPSPAPLLCPICISPGAKVAWF